MKMELDGIPGFSQKTEEEYSKWLHIDDSDPVPQSMTDRFIGVVLNCGEDLSDHGEAFVVPIPGEYSHRRIIEEPGSDGCGP